MKLHYTPYYKSFMYLKISCFLFFFSTFAFFPFFQFCTLFFFSSSSPSFFFLPLFSFIYHIQFVYVDSFERTFSWRARHLSSFKYYSNVYLLKISPTVLFVIFHLLMFCLLFFIFFQSTIFIIYSQLT